MHLTGDQLLCILQALSNPHRLRIIAALRIHGRNYVSRMARDLGLSRPLLYLHLQKLEEAGLVRSTLELSTESKALKFYELIEFDITLTSQAIAGAIASLSDDKTTKP